MSREIEKKKASVLQKIRNAFCEYHITTQKAYLDEKITVTDDDLIRSYCLQARVNLQASRKALLAVLAGYTIEDISNSTLQTSDYQRAEFLNELLTIQSRETRYAFFMMVRSIIYYGMNFTDAYYYGLGQLVSAIGDLDRIEHKFRERYGNDSLQAALTAAITIDFLRYCSEVCSEKYFLYKNKYPKLEHNRLLLDTTLVDLKIIDGDT